MPRRAAGCCRPGWRPRSGLRRPVRPLPRSPTAACPPSASSASLASPAAALSFQRRLSSPAGCSAAGGAAAQPSDAAAAAPTGSPCAAGCPAPRRGGAPSGEAAAGAPLGPAAVRRAERACASAGEKRSWRDTGAASSGAGSELCGAGVEARLSTRQPAANALRLPCDTRKAQTG